MDSGGVQITQLGVSGVIVVMLCIAVKVLWVALQAERAARIEDQRAVLPALNQASAAMTQITAIATLLHEDARG